jgi:hypothetical protein
VTTEHKITKPYKKSKRAKSLFGGLNSINYNDSEKLAEEPLAHSLDESCTSINLQKNQFVCRDRDDSHVISTSSASHHQYKHINMSLQSQESSNFYSKIQIEPQPSTSKHSPFLHSSPATESPSNLKTGVKTRGEMRRNKGIKILKNQRVVLHDNEVTLTDLEEKSEGNNDLQNKNKINTVDLDESLREIDIMDEMRNIFEDEDKEVKPKAKLTPGKVLTEEDLIKMLELDDDDSEEKSDQENVSDDCLYSDASEDATQMSEDNDINSDETFQLTDDEWKTERDPSILPIDFDGYEKKLKIIPETNEPYDYFKLIATEEFFTILVTKINNYASKLLLNLLDPKSRLRLWKDVTVPEIKTFFGILFHMGTIKLNRVTDYWKKHPLFNLPAFSKYMSRNRFLLIMRSLNFGDDLSDNRLSKCNSLINYFNQRMEEVYYPAQNLAIDESMVLFRGRLVFRQYLKGKKHPYGIKLYILTDEYGVVMKTIVYAGSSDTLVGGVNHCEKVVLNLLSNYINKGYSIYMDNFYNSIILAQKLLTLKTYCTGTLRVNRKNNPKEILQRKLKRGESIAKFNSSGICVLKWKDRRDVLMISSKYGSDMTSITNRRGETISKPEVVVKYNRYMGGIDHQDQMLSYYSCEHKTIRWYKKLGVHVFQQMLYNSYTLHNIFSTKKSFYDYRLEIIMKLLNTVEDTKRGSVPKIKVHVLQKCSRKNDGRKRKILRRRCRQCWVSKKVRKDTSYFCADCPEQYGFCFNDCFKEYHNY